MSFLAKLRKIRKLKDKKRRNKAKFLFLNFLFFKKMKQKLDKLALNPSYIFYILSTILRFKKTPNEKPEKIDKIVIKQKNIVSLQNLTNFSFPDKQGIREKIKLDANANLSSFLEKNEIKTQNLLEKNHTIKSEEKSSNYGPKPIIHQNFDGMQENINEKKKAPHKPTNSKENQQNLEEAFNLLFSFMSNNPQIFIISQVQFSIIITQISISAIQENIQILSK